MNMVWKVFKSITFLLRSSDPGMGHVEPPVATAQSYQFLMLGLEGAGKTTFLYKLKINGCLGLEKSERSE